MLSVSSQMSLFHIMQQTLWEHPLVVRRSGTELVPWMSVPMFGGFEGICVHRQCFCQRCIEGTPEKLT